MESDSSDHVVLAFLERLAHDRLRGQERPLADYLRMWPGHERAIAAEFVGMERARQADGTAQGETERVDLLGPYRLLDEIGRGGQGTVFRAEDTRLGRTVAVKVLPVHAARDLDALQRFQREATVAARLDHAGICNVLDVGQNAGKAWIAMRLVDGVPLSRLIADDPASTWLDVATAREPATLKPAAPGSAPCADVEGMLNFFEKAARALHVAHEAGIVHRDIKPGNIMVTPEGEPAIMDFGLARDSAATTLTGTEDVLGTPAYMAPEQVAPRRGGTDRRTDVYALGASLYEALTGQRPFTSPTREGLYRSILEHAPVDPRRLNPRLRRDVKVVMATAMAKESHRRYLSALDLAEDLRRARLREPLRARPPTLPVRLWLWARRRPARAAAVALCGVIVIALGIVALNWDDLVHAQDAMQRALIEEALQDAYLELGEGRPDRAQAAFSRALRLQAGLPEAVAGQAIAHLENGDPRSALAALQRDPTLMVEHPLLRRIAGDAYRMCGEAEDAERVVSGLGEPDSATAWFLMGAREMRRGHAGRHDAFALAYAHFTRAALHAARPRALYDFERAHAAGHTGSKEETTQIADLLQSRWKKNASAWFWAGYALRRHDLRAATECFEQAITIDPEHQRALSSAGRSHQDLGELDRARELLDRLCRVDPTDAEAICLRAGVLVAQGHAREASDEVKRAIAMAPKVWGVRLDGGGVLLAMGRADAAAVEFKKAIDLAPRSAKAWTNLGIARIRLDDDDGAEEAIRNAIALDDGQATAWSALGSLLSGAGKHEDAVAAGRRATELEPGNPDTWYNLGRSFEIADRRDEAIRSYKEALERDRRDIAALTALGLALIVKRDPEAAERWLTEAAKLDHGRIDVWSGIGRARGMLGNMKGAEEALRRALAIDQDDAATLILLAQALDAQRKLVEAAELYRRYLALDDDKPQIWLQLGTVYLDLDRPDDAMAAWTRATDLDPQKAEAWCNRGLLLMRTGHPAEGLPLLERGHAIGSKRPRWTFPSARWIAEAKALLAQGDALSALRAGGALPRDAKECIALAEQAWTSDDAELACRLYTAAFTKDPTLAASRRPPHREAAARAAARSGALGPSVAWLAEELETWRALHENGRVRPQRLERRLSSWLADTDFAPLFAGRIEDHDVAARWRQLADRVQQLLDAL